MSPLVASTLVSRNERDTLDLVGPTEIGELLGVSRSTVFRYMTREDFPAPTLRIGRTPAWERDRIKQWARKTLPLRAGRPRRKT